MELHDAVAPFAFLLGTWRGEGRGHYPTIKDFAFSETLTFEAALGKPFIRYEQRTASSAGAPMHTECGFLRPQGDRVEFTLAQPTGQTELLEGPVSADRRSFDLTSVAVGNASTAKSVTSTRRRYVFDEAYAALHTEFAMAAVGHPLTDHLASDLRRVETADRALRALRQPSLGRELNAELDDEERAWLDAELG